MVTTYILRAIEIYLNTHGQQTPLKQDEFWLWYNIWIVSLLVELGKS